MPPDAAFVRIPRGLAQRLRADGVHDAEQAPQRAGVGHVEPRRRVDEHPIVDDFDVEVPAFVDEQGEQVRREHVERVALVILRAIQGEVPVEVALQGQHLRPVETDRQRAGAEQAVVRLRIQQDVRQDAVEFQREEPPLVRGAIVTRAGAVAVIPEVEVAPGRRREMVGGQTSLAEPEDRSGIGGHSRRQEGQPVGPGEPVQAGPARPFPPAGAVRRRRSTTTGDDHDRQRQPAGTRDAHGTTGAARAQSRKNHHDHRHREHGDEHGRSAAPTAGPSRRP